MWDGTFQSPEIRTVLAISCIFMSGRQVSRTLESVPSRCGYLLIEIFVLTTFLLIKVTQHDLQGKSDQQATNKNQKIKNEIA